MKAAFLLGLSCSVVFLEHVQKWWTARGPTAVRVLTRTVLRCSRQRTLAALRQPPGAGLWPNAGLALYLRCSSLGRLCAWTSVCACLKIWESVSGVFLLRFNNLETLSKLHKVYSSGQRGSIANWPLGLGIVRCIFLRTKGWGDCLITNCLSE